MLALVLAACPHAATAQSDARAAAFALEGAGKNAEAEAAWRKLAAESPSNAEPLAHIGFLEARQEHYATAVAFYRKALAIDPAMPGLHLNLGLAYFKAGQYREAIRVFEPMLKAQPAHSADTDRLTLLLGMSHYGLGEYRAAAPYLMGASASDPQNLTLLLTLANSCLLSHQYPCVIDAYHRIVALNAQSAEADMLVGEALDAMKDTDGAIREFRAAAAANPKEPNVHFGLGYLLWTKKEYEEAAQEFQAELANNPGYTNAMQYLADSELHLDHLDQAQSLLEKIGKSDPSIFLARLDLGMIYAKKDRRADALRELKAAAAIKPDDVDVHWQLGRLYRTMGDMVQAKREFARTRSLNQAENTALVNLMAPVPSHGAAAAGQPEFPQK
ncbi:MAG TPA: tetratricopeptide repeat protein [Acidobacteriaceae bacterium]|jgi:tetratricopeptide (TPR) repeat protein|nr:tetratricopeptide repeat protein [Acidobacteriaceae bacterium]